MKKYKYNINNLDCANCALQVEKELNKHFVNAKVNFNTSKITFESDKECTLKEINKIVTSVEPDASVSLEKNENKKRISFIYTCYCSYNMFNRLFFEN